MRLQLAVVEALDRAARLEEALVYVHFAVDRRRLRLLDHEVFHLGVQHVLGEVRDGEVVVELEELGLLQDFEGVSDTSLAVTHDEVLHKVDVEAERANELLRLRVTGRDANRGDELRAGRVEVHS